MPRRNQNNLIHQHIHQKGLCRIDLDNRCNLWTGYKPASKHRHHFSIYTLPYSHNSFLKPRSKCLRSHTYLAMQVYCIQNRYYMFRHIFQNPLPYQFQRDCQGWRKKHQTISPKRQVRQSDMQSTRAHLFAYFFQSFQIYKAPSKALKQEPCFPAMYGVFIATVACFDYTMWTSFFRVGSTSSFLVFFCI